MTQEDKQLLLKDLCARLPYEVKIWMEEKSHKDIEDRDKIYPIEGIRRDCVIVHGAYYSVEGHSIQDFRVVVKPYLRPMSSMTEEEKIELCTISYAPDEMKTIDEKLYVIQTNAENAADFYNKHHFDYRGLIEKGLALEAPEGMYNVK